MAKPIKKSGTYQGKSNKLGHGGRPEGVIGGIARKKQAAPGQKNYHPHRKSK